jgi:hypothetical protein
MSEDRDPPDDDAPSPDSFDASDAAQVRRRRRTAIMREAQKREFVGRILSDDVGRRFFWEFLSDAHVFDERFGVAGSGNCPEASWYYRGEREIGLQLLRRFMAWQPHLAAIMLAENENG